MNPKRNRMAVETEPQNADYTNTSETRNGTDAEDLF